MSAISNVLGDDFSSQMPVVPGPPMKPELTAEQRQAYRESQNGSHLTSLTHATFDVDATALDEDDEDVEFSDVDDMECVHESSEDVDDDVEDDEGDDDDFSVVTTPPVTTSAVTPITSTVQPIMQQFPPAVPCNVQQMQFAAPASPPRHMIQIMARPSHPVIQVQPSPVQTSPVETQKSTGSYRGCRTEEDFRKLGKFITEVFVNF